MRMEGRPGRPAEVNLSLTRGWDQGPVACTLKPLVLTEVNHSENAVKTEDNISKLHGIALFGSVLNPAQVESLYTVLGLSSCEHKNWQSQLMQELVKTAWTKTEWKIIFRIRSDHIGSESTENGLHPGRSYRFN